MRKRLWKIHSVAGLIAGLALLVIGLTGSVLVFSREVDALCHPRLTRASPGVRLPLDTLFTRAEAQLPGWEITRWIVRLDEPGAADELRLCPTNGNDYLLGYVDPYTGAMLGRRTWLQTVSGWLLQLHYSFFLGDWGTVFAGLMAALLLVSAVSGVWLYRGFWKSLLRLRWRASARIFFSDLHKTVGISSVAFNLVLGFTGAWWNLQSLPNLWHHEPPVLRFPGRLFSDRVSLDALLTDAARAFPGLEISPETTINFPFRAGEEFSVTGRVPTANPFLSAGSGTVSFDSRTGAVTKVDDVRARGLWAQCEDMMGPLHFGTFGGLPIKVLWCLGGLSPGVLAVSGFLLWRARQRGRRRALPPAPGSGVTLPGESQPSRPLTVVTSS